VSQLRLALCQINTTVGDLEGNLETILAALGEAEEAGADLAVFPELAITGYPPEDLLLEPGFVSQNLDSLAAVAAATTHCTAVVGFVDRGRDLANAAAVCSGGVVRGVWHKELLPNYSVFDERRWFAPGRGANPLFLIAGMTVGVTICEDAWSPSGPVLRLAQSGAELVVVLNASPYRSGVLQARQAMLGTRAADASCALGYVNAVGGQDELVFDGGSMIFDLEGRLLASAPQFEESMLVYDLVHRASYRKRLLEPRGLGQRDGALSPRDEDAVVVLGEPIQRARGSLGPARPGCAPVLGRLEEIYQALVLGTHDYARKNGFSDAVIALSGGIDSSLVATIAVDALGPRHTHGIVMPSRYSTESSSRDALSLGSRLAIETLSLSIESVHASVLGLLAPVFGDASEDVTEENLQARIRGTLLMALSNKFGWLVLTTGNKSEMAVGYATLYGDMAGGFAVIKDVPKTLVYELCSMRNEREGRDLIPEAILAKAPSAELRPNQRDDDSLPPYPILDALLEAYIEHDASLAELVALGFDEELVARIVALVDRAEYKRRQAPPGIRVTSHAFGKDRRMPITNGYRHHGVSRGRPDDPRTRA